MKQFYINGKLLNNDSYKSLEAIKEAINMGLIEVDSLNSSVELKEVEVTNFTITPKISDESISELIDLLIPRVENLKSVYNEDVEHEKLFKDLLLSHLTKGKMVSKNPNINIIILKDSDKFYLSFHCDTPSNGKVYFQLHIDGNSIVENVLTRKEDWRNEIEISLSITDNLIERFRVLEILRNNP